MIDERGTGLREARAAGELLAASGSSDAVDALIVMVALPGDQLLTGDPPTSVSSQHVGASRSSGPPGHSRAGVMRIR